MDDLIVTTTDLDRSYEVIGLVNSFATMEYFSSNSLNKLWKKYKTELQPLYNQGEHLKQEPSEKALFAEQICRKRANLFSVAYPILVMELRQKAIQMGADAVIGMHFVISPLASIGGGAFLIHGTAVRFIH